MEKQPPKDPSASVPIDMSAMLQAIEKLIAAAAEVAEAIKGHPAESRENPLTTYQHGSIISKEAEVNPKRELPVTMNALELPESLTAIPGVEIIEVNAPQIYAKFYCHVCTREWIVPIPLDTLSTYQPPKKCRWCETIVWTNPERAQVRSDQRSKRDVVTSRFPSQTRARRAG